MAASSIARVVLLLLGLALLLGAFLVEPDEERWLRNRLVDWWVDATEKRETLKDKLVAGAQAIARYVCKLYDRLFGPQIVSLQFVEGSILVTQAVCCAVWLLLGLGALGFDTIADADTAMILALTVGQVGSAVALGAHVYTRRTRHLAIWLVLGAASTAVDQKLPLQLDRDDLHALDSRPPSRGLLFSLAAGLIVLALAPSPVDVLWKWLGMPAASH